MVRVRNLFIYGHTAFKVDNLYRVSKGRTTERAFRRPNGGASGIKPQSRTKNQYTTSINSLVLEIIQDSVM